MTTSLSTACAERDFVADTPSAAGDVRVVAARLDLGPGTVAALAAWLSPPELERARRCRLERDRRRFIVGRARLRQLIARCLAIRPRAVEFADGRNGKPVLAAGMAESGLHFNMSRSGDLAVYALSPACRVGIDVEEVREIRGAAEIAAQFFSRREYAAYHALDPGQRRLGFLNCWTRKEAFVKALGDGLSYACASFDVTLAPGEPARLLRVGEVAGDDAGWRLEALTRLPGFVGALVTEFRRPPLM